MDTETLKELVPHYVAMLLLVFAVLAVVRTVVGDLDFWIEMAIVFVVVFAYRPIVDHLGYAPKAWQ